MPLRNKGVPDASSPAAHTRSKEDAGGVRSKGRTGGPPETPKTRAKRKLKEAKKKAAAKHSKSADASLNMDPVVVEEVVEEPKRKKRVVGSSGSKTNKKRKQAAPKKLVYLVPSPDDSDADGSEYEANESESDGDKDVHLGDLSDDDEESEDNMAAKLKKMRDKQKKDAERAYAEGGFEALERNFEVTERRRRNKELNRLAQEGAADPLSNDSEARPTKQNRKESKRRAQEGAADPLSDDDEDDDEDEDEDEDEDGNRKNPVPPWATKNGGREQLSSAELEFEVPTVEKNVKQRIMLYVKNNMFRTKKFITSPKHFTMAFQRVLLMERPKNPYVFQLTYEKCFNTALNQKRSTCEQAGFRIVRDAINKDFKKRGEEFYTFEEFCKLRRATSDREKNAFFWFFNTFLECVCGANVWRNAKTKQLVSAAREANGSKIVSVSDEAFGLLLFDKYLEKWRTLAEEEASTAPGEAETGSGQGKQKMRKIPGKYTAKEKGNCKYSGWSTPGINQFNRLRKVVQDDRECPEAAEMEKELLAFCRTSAGKTNAGNQEDQPVDENAADNNALQTAEELEPVEADWDSDSDEIVYL